MIRYITQFMSGKIDFLTLMIYIGSMIFVVFCATPLHEFAHAATAVKLGDDTPKRMGRLTINPMAHIDWIGALMIALVGFGYAKPVEVRMRNFKRPKLDMAIVALAGPLCNLLQAFLSLAVCSLVYHLGTSSSTLSTPAAATFSFFFYAAFINVNLAVFNLIPIPPLDGSRILTAVLPSKWYYKLMQYERYITIAIFVLLLLGWLSTPLYYLSSSVMRGFLSLLNLPTALVG